ncbi:MAG: HPr family phosphocarrier protein [Lachnospiraceae bacterium]|nr:HPr family phosphocarrier protein [Lachnospiraceae bacterium]
MVQRKYIVQLENGMHLRPAGVLCTEAARYDCKIRVRGSHKEVSAKSLLGVVGAMIKQGDEIVITYDGNREEEVAESMTGFLQEEGIAVPAET